MEDDDPATVRRMLTYLYTVDYDDKCDNTGLASAGAEPATSQFEQVKADSSLIDQMIADVLVYAIADKYNIPELKELSMSKFEALLDDESVPNKFAAVVDAVYTTTPDTDFGLRDMVIDYCAENIDTFAESEEYFRIFQDRGDFGRSVLGAVLCTHKDKIDEETDKNQILTDKKNLTAVMRSLKIDLQGLSGSAGKYMTRVPNAMIEDFKFRLDAMND